MKSPVSGRVENKGLIRPRTVQQKEPGATTAPGLRVAQSVDDEVTNFVWDWASGVPEMLSEDQAMVSSIAPYLVGHETLGYWNGNDWTYHLPDALGSVRQLDDAAGHVTLARWRALVSLFLATNQVWYN